MAIIEPELLTAFWPIASEATPTKIFDAVAQVLFGDEIHSYELRLRTAIEVFFNRARLTAQVEQYSAVCDTDAALKDIFSIYRVSLVRLPFRHWQMQSKRRFKHTSHRSARINYFWPC